MNEHAGDVRTGPSHVIASSFATDLLAPFLPHAPARVEYVLSPKSDLGHAEQSGRMSASFIVGITSSERILRERWEADQVLTLTGAACSAFTLLPRAKGAAIGSLWPLDVKTP